MSVSDRLGDPACRRTLDRVAAPVRLSIPGEGVVFVNRAWCEVTGTTIEDNLDDGWLQAVHEADRARVLLELAASPVATPSDYRLQTRQGRTVPVSDCAAAWAEDAAASAGGVVHTLTIRDVGSLAGQTMSKWAHELRGPLNAILGWSDLLGSGENDPDVLQRGLKAIANNARQQAIIIKKMTE